MADAPTTDVPVTDATATAQPLAGDTIDAALGAEGEKALAAFKERAREAERDARNAKAELEKLRIESMGEAEKAVAQARLEGRAEALQTANARLLSAEVKAAAAGKLANPSLAPRLLDLTQFTLSDDGDVDTDAINKAIDRLLKSDPYLAAGATTPGSFDPGPRGGGSAGPDMNSQIRRAAGRA